MSVEHITKVSVHDGTSFVPVYEGAAGAGTSSEVFTIDLDEVSMLLLHDKQYHYNNMFSPSIVIL